MSHCGRDRAIIIPPDQHFLYEYWEHKNRIPALKVPDSKGTRVKEAEVGASSLHRKELSATTFLRRANAAKLPVAELVQAWS